LGKKKKHAKKNKIRSEKIKKIDDEIYSKKLMELEDVIYTYRNEELLSYFFEEFKQGKAKKDYIKSVSSLSDLNIECLEFAIARFTQIDNNLSPDRRYLNVIMPLFVAFLVMLSRLSEVINFFGILLTGGTLFYFLFFLNKDRKNRGYANAMLITFEQVHARKQKEKE